MNFYIYLFNNVNIIHQLCEEIFYKLYKQGKSPLKDARRHIYIYILECEGDFFIRRKQSTTREAAHAINSINNNKEVTRCQGLKLYKRGESNLRRDKYKIYK